MNQSAMLTEFARTGDFDCFLLAGRYTLLDQSGLGDLLPECAARGISVIVGRRLQLRHPRRSVARRDLRLPARVRRRCWPRHARSQDVCAPPRRAAARGRAAVPVRAPERGVGARRHAFSGRGRRRGRDGVGRDPRTAVARPEGRRAARRGGADAVTHRRSPALLDRRLRMARRRGADPDPSRLHHRRPAATSRRRRCGPDRPGRGRPVRRCRDGRFLALAASTPEIAGVVGWASLCDPDLAETLATSRRARRRPPGRHPRSGARRSPDDFLDRADVRAGLAAVAKRRPGQRTGGARDQLPSVIGCRAHAGRVVVLDHLGKPRIAAGVTAWRVALAGGQIAECPNVIAKLSGLRRGGRLGDVDGR